MTNLIKLDRTELDKAIAELEGMYSATAKVLADYEAEKADLEKRGDELNERLNELQHLHAETLLKREEEKNTAEYVKLSKQLKDADDEVQIIQSLQEQLSEDKLQLKQKYVPLIRSSHGKDTSARNALDVNYVVEDVIYELMSGIADFSNTVRKENDKVIGTIRDEFLDDRQLMENNKVFKRQFDYGVGLSYSSTLPNVLNKHQVNYATAGNIHPEIRKPQAKEVK
ncbi:hypothetical protein [Oceanobacillus sojae]|uniref:hypothetical protein n=1 Tax=Oceanobacillus sojae TaxID=582851 RepID=UPI0021A3FF96|nr:hypothetical protein [Oceanobacillus sojae]MCT1905266.1 hypothetical protein [Oceanobacillus sojae]